MITGIPYIKKDEGSGSYLRLYMGTSMFEKSIFVDEKDAEKALELIENIKAVDDNIENNDDTDKDENIKGDSKINIAKILLGIMIFMFVLPFVIMLIFYMSILFRKII